MSAKEDEIIYQYPQQVGMENTLTIACGSEGFTVTGHSNEIPFPELEDRIMRIVQKVSGKMKEEPKVYHG